ncbi:FAD-binding protein [Ensifer adhaerens]
MTVPIYRNPHAGLSGDEFGRVLDENSEPIPGLYACGNDLASIFRGTYPGPGTTIGPAMVFGWRVAKHAAGKLDDMPGAPSEATTVEKKPAKI